MNDPMVTFVADNRKARLYRIDRSPEEYIWDNQHRYSVDYSQPICPAPCQGVLSTNDLYGVAGRGITKSAVFTVPEAGRVTVKAKTGSSTAFALGLTAALTGASAGVAGVAMTTIGGDVLVPGLITLGIGLALMPLGIYLVGKGATHVRVTAEQTPRLQRPPIKPADPAKEPEPRDVFLIFPRIEPTTALSSDEGRTVRLALPQTPIAVVNHIPTGRSLGSVRTRDIEITSVTDYRNLRCGFGREWTSVNEEMPKSYLLPSFCDDFQDPSKCHDSTLPIVDKALDELRVATANKGGWVATDIWCFSGKNSFGDGRIWCEATAEGP
jgi:hypothetical protein